MANKESKGTVKVRRPRQPQHFVVEMQDGKISGILDKAALVESLPQIGGKFKAIYSIKPVFVRRVEVIKFGKPRAPRADKGTVRADA